MAFTPRDIIYVLDFTDTELDGLTVQTRSADIGWVLDLSSLIDTMGDVPDPDEVSIESAAGGIDPAKVARYQGAMAGMRTLIDNFANVLVSWDMEIPAGNPLPASVDGLRRINPRHLMMIVKAWQQVVSQVPTDLGKDSIGGAPSPVASLPMEPLSVSRVS